MSRIFMTGRSQRRAQPGRSCCGLLLAVASLCVCTGPAWSEWNEPNVEGAKEHPLLKYYPEARVAEYESKNYDSAEILTAFNKGAEEPAKKESIEGRITKYSYEHKPGTSPLEIVRQYEGALKKAGFATAFIGKGGDDNPGLDANPGEAVGSFRLDKGGKPAAYVYVHAVPGDPGATSLVTIAEVKLMEQKLEADANALFDEISKSGRVAVYGINFDTGKATIRPDSDKVLGEVNKLLTQHQELKLRIEGHTDNVGAAPANKKLSEDRAGAVKSWLVGKGVKGERLATTGLGDTKPVGDNASEAGRAKNRRVELVKQ